MGLSLQPVRNALIHRETKMTNQGHGPSRGIESPDAHSRLITPSTIRTFQMFETSNQVQQSRRCVTQILPGAQGDKCSVSRTVSQFGIHIISAVRFPEPLDVLKNPLVKPVRNPGPADFCPAPGQGSQVNQVQAGAVPE